MKKKEMQSPPPVDWENLCHRCGGCCFEKCIDDRGRIISTPVPCRFLDIITRQCRVYHKRFAVDKDCIQLTPEVVRSLEWLPEHCAYRTSEKDGD